jgi:hypothetical protein
MHIRLLKKGREERGNGSREEGEKACSKSLGLLTGANSHGYSYQSELVMGVKLREFFA